MKRIAISIMLIIIGITLIFLNNYVSNLYFVFFFILAIINLVYRKNNIPYEKLTTKKGTINNNYIKQILQKEYKLMQEYTKYNIKVKDYIHTYLGISKEIIIIKTDKKDDNLIKLYNQIINTRRKKVKKALQWLKNYDIKILIYLKEEPSNMTGLESKLLLQGKISYHTGIVIPIVVNDNKAIVSSFFSEYDTINKFYMNERARITKETKITSSEISDEKEEGIFIIMLIIVTIILILASTAIYLTESDIEYFKKKSGIDADYNQVELLYQDDSDISQIVIYTYNEDIKDKLSDNYTLVKGNEHKIRQCIYEYKDIINLDEFKEKTLSENDYFYLEKIDQNNTFRLYYYDIETQILYYIYGYYHNK